jgi:hypothetical protein
VRPTKMNFRFWREIARSKSQSGMTKAAQITCRLLFIYAPLTLPLSLPFTLTSQNALRAFHFTRFDLHYGQTQVLHPGPSHEFLLFCS